jgi:hypothetical protein
LFSIALLLLLFPCLTGEVRAFPCKDETPTLGESLENVAADCGEAALKDQRTITVEEKDQGGTHRTVTRIVEWTYDPGPEELVQSYRFENDKLVDISTHGYGTVRDFSIDTCHNGEALSVGDSIIETYLKCGEPIAKEMLKGKIIESESDGIKRRTTLPVVEWTYRYGPNAPGYTVTFENGQATDIRTREFGR